MNGVYGSSKVVDGAEGFDVFGLMALLFRQKIIIVSFIFFFGLVGVAYSYWAKKEYQFGTTLRPVALNQLDALNRSDVYSLSPEDALMRVGLALGSYESRFQYFQSNPALFADIVGPGLTAEQGFERFNRLFTSLGVFDQGVAGRLGAYVALDMRYPNGATGAQVLNGFVQYVIQQERTRITRDLDVIVKNRLAELNAKIDAARLNYEADKASRIAVLQEADRLRRAQLQDELAALRLQLAAKRKDRISELGEAISIARDLGIKRPTTPSAMGDEGRSAAPGTVRNEVSMQAVPLYFLGVEALEAERGTLQQRKSDDFTDGRIAEIGKELKLLEVNRQIQQLKQRQNEDEFLVGLEPLRAEIMRLSHLGIDFDSLQIVTVDRKAIETVAPVKPQKILAIGISLLIGLVVGVIMVLLRDFVSVHRARRAAGLIPIAPLERAGAPLAADRPTLA